MASRKPDPFLTETDPDYEAEVEQQKIADAMAGAISRIEGLAREAVDKRKTIETRWLSDLRLYYGRYDETTEKNLQAAEGQKSRAFIPLARAKTNLWEAELGDRLFPADDKNYGVGPTPVPELVETAEAAKRSALEARAKAKELRDEQAAQEAAAIAQAGEGGTPVMPPQDAAQEADGLDAAAAEAEAHEAEIRETLSIASKRAEAMEREIDDQLTECQYPKRCRDVIADACRLGVGIIKGPLFSSKPKRAWRQVEENVFQLEPVQNDKPEFVRVDPWNFFPDPNAQEMENSEYELERHLPNKRQLRKMAKELDFNREAVRQLLDAGPGHGSPDDLHHLAQIRSITNEGDAVTGRYVVWEYHGALEVDEVCALLRGIGKDEEAYAFEEKHDPLDEIRVVIHFCDGKLLKLAEEYILDSGETLYSVFSFEKSEGSILGSVGVPNLMADALAALNAAWRMMLDNAALAVGPQVVVDKSQIEPEDGDWRLTGRKVWERKGEKVTPDAKPFESFDIPMNQAQLAGIIEIALKFIDDVTGLTLPGHGEQAPPSAQTLGGLAIQLNAANVVFRRVVKNFDDDLTTPVIRRLYDWNMQFNPKAEIKGDMKVEARGTSALLVKEIQSQHLMAITQNWSSHPVLGAALKIYDTMRMALQSLSINADDLLVTKDEFETKLANMAQQAPSPEEIRAQASLQVAEITAQSKREQAENDRYIAELNYEGEVMRMAAASEQHRDKLMAMIEDKREERAARSHDRQQDRTHKERLKAVEIGVEQQREMRAEARGIPAVEASGKEIG